MKQSRALKRVFYHYQELEEFHAGMWKRLTGEPRKRFIELASSLMRDTEAFRGAMRAATIQWPKSCAAAFTTDGLNQIAFLGHAGCCVSTGSPEECTRVAWHTLSRDEQDRANAAAGDILTEWGDQQSCLKSQLELMF